MLELILSALGLGIMLSLVFIGPVFFLLIETSITRGPRHALALDLGVVLADIVCILVAYYSSHGLVNMIDSHPSFYRITAIIILFYAVFMIFKKTKMHVEGGEQKFISKNYYKTFINGFVFNILNIGVVLFWLVTVISVRKTYPKIHEFLFYMCIVIFTYLCIDLLKIFLAKQFKNKLNDNVAGKIRKIVGFVLIGFSVFVFLQSFKKFNQFDRRLEESGYHHKNNSE